MDEHIRVVLDTNVIVSGAIRPQSIPAAVVSAGLARQVLICCSDQILDEYREVLARGKFRLPLRAIGALLADLERSGEKAQPQRKLSVCLDADDNKFLECAEQAKADYLVTGNRQRFPARHRATAVVTPRRFITILISAGII